MPQLPRCFVTTDPKRPHDPAVDVHDASPRAWFASRLKRTTGRGVTVAVMGMGTVACGGSQSQAEAAPSERELPPDEAAALASLEAEPEEPVPEVVAPASLKPLVASIVPGKAFRMALYFEIADGWRLSWENPGDVGEVPDVRFSAPDGFEVGPLEWPGPRRFRVAEDLTSYGYEGDAAVFTTIRAPKNIETNAAYRFSVEAEWVACKQQCAKENANAFVELVADWNGGQAVEHEALERLAERLPKPFSDLEGSEHAWSGGGERRRLVLRAPSVKFVDFYPASLEVALEEVAIAEDGGELSLSFDQVPDGQPVHGVVKVDRQGAPEFFAVEAPPAGGT